MVVLSTDILHRGYCRIKVARSSQSALFQGSGFYCIEVVLSRGIAPIDTPDVQHLSDNRRVRV